ncbi:S6 family peptidase [Pantoea sp. RRHST58]|uniref:S6 family peptidase n=1 Tax=Pantoea sp. RRHST58 TaxID=3425183 RepID=UPI003DA15F04
MRHDIDVQEYRDFAENLGSYSVGSTNIAVYKKDGSLSGYLDFAMPDFGMVANYGYSTLVAPSYVASVRHNTGYKTVGFGNGAQYGATYTLINRNEFPESGVDFHLPRLNKVVTDAAPVGTVEKSEIMKGDSARYSWFTRIGGGTQSQVSEDQSERIQLSGAYKWVSGGTVNAATVRFTSGTLRAINYGPDNPLTSPLSIGTMAGDSGSPMMVYDEQDRAWKIVGVLYGSMADPGTAYGKTSGWEYIPDGYIQTITAANISPDVVDSPQGGTIYWNDSTLAQQDTLWSWTGLDKAYASAAPATASNEELDATKDLRFNGAGGLILLNGPVNMGAGKLQFSNDYTLSAASGVNATWVGGGVEVDAGKKVLWQVNGLANDALHKIGAGTLHVNAEGINAGSLNVGDGTVILDQQADAAGNKQAFSSVTLVSGRPTVVLKDADQVATSDIYFGYRGGKLDLNGNTLTFKKINHTDSGATLLNHSASQLATLNITGYTADDVPFNRFNGSNPKGTPGSLYVYNNPYTKETEYFQLNKSSYWYFPTDKSSTDTWTYLGTDSDAAVNYRLTQLNQQVFRGFLGETDPAAVNGGLNVALKPENATAITALTGGMNLNGTLSVENGTAILSGQPVAHAGGVAREDDWSTSLFKADEISVGKGAALQVGEYASVQARFVADESARLAFGYNDSEQAEEKSWRCYSLIYQDATACSQPVRNASALALLPASDVAGDVALADRASLYLGKVNYQGAVTSTGSTRMTLDGNARWTMTGNSRVSTLQAQPGATLSTVPTGNWQAKTLDVDALDATGLNLMLGVKPATLESDRLTIRNVASGGDNLLDVSLLVGARDPVALKQDLVMIDAPAGTAHDYFSFADGYSGFSVYTPNYQVKEENDRVLWVLERNQTQPDTPTAPAPPETDPPAPQKPAPDADSDTPAEDNTPPQPDAGKPAQDSTTPQPDADTPAQDNSAPQPDAVAPAPGETTSETSTDKPAQTGNAAEQSESDEKTEAAVQPEEPVTPPAFNPDEWFTIHDNQPLIQNTRALMASRQYIFSEAIGQLYKRSDRLRASPDNHGVWATLEHSKGGFAGLNATQQTLNVGWDKQNGAHTLGFSASYAQGKIKGKGEENHRLATAGAYYSWQSDAGWFTDAASRLMYLNQEITLDPALGITRKKRNSTLLAGSVRSGYQFSLANDSLLISPFVGLSAGVLSGYSLQGQDAEVSLSSSRPWYATGGVMAQKRGLGEGMKNLNLTASIAWQYSPGKNGSTTTLADRQASRQYQAWSDNRYRASVGVEGAIAKNMSLNAGVESSFGGVFKTDYSGTVGLSYHF